MLKCTYMVWINFSFSADSVPPRVKIHLIKTLIPGMRSFLLSFCPGMSKRFSNHNQLLLPYCPLEMKDKSILLKITCTPLTGCRDSWSWIATKTTFLKTNFHGIKRYHASLQRSKGARVPSIHDGDEAHQQTPWHEALRVQQWHTYLVGNQQLSKWT